MEPEEILKEIKMRPGMDCNSEMLLDMIKDCIEELKLYLNYSNTEQLPTACKQIIKQLVFIKYNQDGNEGIQSKSDSGVSTSYLPDLPASLMRQIRKLRKLPG